MGGTLSLYLAAPVIAWLLAHTIKFLILVSKGERGDFFRSGGMPSAHSALMMSVTVVIGGLDGVESSLFALGLVVTAIVAYDACHVRLAVGEQAELVNELTKKNDLKTRVRVVKGHTLLEVVVGLVLGLAVALLLLQLS